MLSVDIQWCRKDLNLRADRDGGGVNRRVSKC